MSEERWGFPFILSERVEQLLEDGTLTEIFNYTEKDLMESWVKTPPCNVQEREQIYQQIHALNHIELKLAQILSSLKNARGDYAD